MLVGDTLPLNYQLSDYNDGVFVQATLYDDTNTPIGSPANLVAIGILGYYGNTSKTFPPGTKWVSVSYICYDDSGFTQLSQTEGGGQEVFFLTQGGTSTGLPTGSYITGFLDGSVCESCEPNSIQDTIVTGSDRTLFIRLASIPNLLPFDLTGASLVSCSFVNADGSILTLNSTGGSPPVVVTTAKAGQLYCVLTAAQTVLLGVANPAPLTITVVQSVGTTIVNFPYQLSIEPPLV